jgi:hypothetical protein
VHLPDAAAGLASRADTSEGPINMPEWEVPGYTELREIGAGGQGHVVLARHDASGILVAIKYLRHYLLADPEFGEMFRSEAVVLASLDDPNVVRLYEYVESPSGAAIVMELIDGVSLREILAHQGATTPEAALVVLQGSLLGLAAAHRRGVVHRDYKPENVLVDGDGISKLTDFGIAARTGDHAIPAGTLPYAAPEQMAGEPASPASDIYAATATFYECLTGRPPFSGDTVEMLLRQHRSAPVPLDPLPEPLRPLVAAGMAKDPARRPTDATTFITELNTAATGAYGRHWHDRGRSHLGEAALLLAALWPSGGLPAAQGAAVERTPLGQPQTWRTGARSSSGRRQSGRRRSRPDQPDDAVSRAVREVVRPGLLAFNPSAEMIQGRKERVEVGIARSSELRQALAAGLRGRGEPQFEEVDTSPLMGVELKGAAFEITPLSPLEQLVAPLARWEFDVTPSRAGHQTLTLCISLRVDVINSGLTSGGRIAVPVLERDIRIRVDVAYGARRFVAANWQWLIVTAAGFGGTIAAWITLFH